MSQHSRDVVVVWNAGAGSTEEAADLRQRMAAVHGLRVIESDSPQAAQTAVMESVRSGCRRIIAAGGDGTVGTVVDALAEADTRAELAVLPLGTGNDLARSLNMPLDPDAALDVCLNGQTQPMDVILAETGSQRRNVANMVTAGNSGRYTQVLTDEIKRVWGPFCYVRGVLDVLPDLTVYDVTCRFDGGEPECFSVLNVFLANGRTSGGGVLVAPVASLDDGLLDCVLILDGTPLELASLTADYVMTSFLSNDLVVWRRCRSVEIAARQPLPFSADGDVLGEAPAVFTVRQGALDVVRGPSPGI